MMRLDELANQRRKATTLTTSELAAFFSLSITEGVFLAPRKLSMDTRMRRTKKYKLQNNGEDEGPVAKGGYTR